MLVRLLTSLLYSDQGPSETICRGSVPPRGPWQQYPFRATRARNWRYPSGDPAAHQPIQQEIENKLHEMVFPKPTVISTCEGSPGKQRAI